MVVRVRGRVRGKQSNFRRIVVTPPKNRQSLLRSSALHGGALAIFGAALAMPRPRWLSVSTALAVATLGGVMVLPAGEALAACAQSPTNTWTCTTSGPVSNSGPQATIAPSANGFVIGIGKNGVGSDTYTDTGNFNDSNLGGIVIANPNYSGTITLTGTSTLKANKADGLRFYDTGTVLTPTVVFNINGTLYGGNDAAGSSGYTLSPGDGLHVGQSGTHAPTDSSDGLIGTLTVNVGNSGNSDAVIRAADDGIEIAQNIATQVTVTNYGTISGLGRKGDNTGVADATNWGEGVHISTVDKGYGSGYQIDGAATLTNHGTIIGRANTGDTHGDGAGSGVDISAKGAINITNTQDASDGLIRGTDGVVAYGNGSSDITLTNTGHIEGTAGSGSILSHADDISVENHSLGSLMGTTTGQVISDANSTSYDNSSGLTAGLGGNGLVIHDIKGVTTDPAPQYNIIVDNTQAAEGESGGIIVGYGSGVSMYGNEYAVSYAAGKNGVLLDNSGTGSDETGQPGGLIVGVTGNGVEITGTYGDVRVDNSYTRNGTSNDLTATAIDGQVGYDGKSRDSDPAGTTLLDKRVSGSDAPFTYELNPVLGNAGTPTGLDGGISTGIWGNGWGLYEENIGGVASVYNTYGQIFGKGGDGIKLASIGGSLTESVATVVDIDNSHGLIEGGNDGVKLTTIEHGGVSFNNNSGMTLGGVNGIEMEGVAGSVTAANEDGLIGGFGGEGLKLTTVGGTATLENEGGVSMGVTGNGATISYVSGAGSAGEDAVAIYNGNGGLFAGEGGIEISHVTGDSSEGEANDIFIDNSARYLGAGDFSDGGVIVGVNGDGINIHDAGAIEGESGSILIDNRRTLHTTVDLGELAGEFLYAEGDGGGPSVGLLGPFADLYGEDGVVGSGIYGTIGIAGSDIGGPVSVLNEDGLIVGSDTAIELARIGDDIEIDNGRAWRHGDGGTIMGGAVGISVSEGEGGLTIDNRHGTIAANNTSGPSAGIYADRIEGIVDIDNSYGGVNVVAGAGFGITLNNTGAATITNHDGVIASEGDAGYAIYAYGDESLTIDNSRGWHGDGGLIYGAKYGIAASYTGDIEIDNGRGTILTASSGANANGDAIALSNISGDVTIDNARGTIFGAADGDVGISAHVVSGHVSIDNGSYHVDPGDIEDYGFIGGAIGIELADISEGAEIDNSRGVVYGHEQGIVIDQANGEGDIEIQNSGGSIEGYLKNGIKISKADDVYIYNGEDHGGTIFGGINAEGGSAIDVQAFTVAIVNGQSWTDAESEGDTVQGGLIVGAGTGPVIALDTSQSEGGGASVTNMGIISALGPNAYRFTDDNESGGPEAFDSYLGDVTLPFAASLPLSNDLLPSEGGLQGIYDDAADIRDFVFNDPDGSIDKLGNYSDAAAALAIEGRTGATWVWNDPGGLIFGRVDLDGVTQADNEDDADFGSVVLNSGIWFTTGTNTLTGDGENFIANGGGLIQTAMKGVAETTTFVVDSFYNAFNMEVPSEDGALSMVDGDATDLTTISGDFFGAATEGGGGFGTGRSFLALDAFLDLPEGEGGHPAADLLHIGGDAYGTTGLIINNLNSSEIAQGNEAGIKVIEVAGADAMACVDEACKEGDTFYIASQSANYLDINGVGTIQQGMFAWYLTEKDNDPDPDYYLATAALPTAEQTPGAITAFNTIFYDGTDLVSEHLYGGHFPKARKGPGAGGGGGDVAPDGGDSSTTNAAIWGRVSGSWANKDSQITSTAFGPVDTGYDQRTYTLLGGVDMSPGGEDSGLRLGVYGGYAAANVSFDSYATKAKFEGGVAGGYVAYKQNDFYADAQFTADMLNMTYNAPFGGGVSASTDGTTLGVMANIGNRFHAGNSFIEPIASFTYANTTLGDLQSGTARVSFSNGESLRAGAGARIGTTVHDQAGTIAEFSLLGRVWNEFSGNNVVTITDGSNTDTFTDDNSGMFGEVSGSATLYASGQAFSTYISGGATFKADATTWNAKVGLRQGF